MTKTVGVLTGGGDCPGLNAVIRAVARRLLGRGYAVAGIRDGWRGLLDGRVEPLGAGDVSGILPRGGTILGTTGFEPAPGRGRGRAGAGERARAGDALVVVGGDGTLGVAARLHGLGLPVVGVPKTIDNDIPGTEATPSATTRRSLSRPRRSTASTRRPSRTTASWSSR